MVTRERVALAMTLLFLVGGLAAIGVALWSWFGWEAAVVWAGAWLAVAAILELR